jgi:hypothetical protein
LQEELIMKSMKPVAALAAVAAASLCALVGAGGASATTLCVVGSPPGAGCPAGSGPGGAFALTSGNAMFNVGGAIGTVTCRSAGIAGTAPAISSSTSITVPVALTWSGCSGPLGAASVAISASCRATSIPPTMTFDYNGGRPYTFEKLPQGCDVQITFLAIACQVVIAGPTTIGNGTPGAGGQQWINGSARLATPSRDVFNNDVVNYTTATACPGGPRTSPGTYAATYTVTTPATAPGMTVEP